MKPARVRFTCADEGEGWSDLTVVCRGTRVNTVVTGIVRTEWDGAGVRENAAHRARNVGRRGHSALQLHAGDELRIWFIDIKVRELGP